MTGEQAWAELEFKLPKVRGVKKISRPRKTYRSIPPVPLASEAGRRCEAITARNSRCTRDAVCNAFEVPDPRSIVARYCCRVHCAKKRLSAERDAMGYGIIAWWPKEDA